MRLRLGLRRLNLKPSFFLLVAIILVLIIIAMMMGLNITQKSQAMSTLLQPKRGGRWFQVAQEEMDMEFVHLERQWKEPTWPVANILRQLPTKKKPVVPVFVVEEHYEVLKYWFDAADTGVIPKRGNTLLHIDGHSDAAPPRDLSLVPWFRLPKNHSEVANMMQSNDVFIAGSGLAGLINRYIWVWPDWDRGEHSKEADHEVNDVKAGWRTYYPHDGKPFLRHCACARLRFPNSTGAEDWECWDEEPDPSEVGESSVARSLECHAVVTGIMETVHESKALELLKKGDWIRKDEKVILDIDEDYYGCESSVMPLYNAGFTQDSVNQLSDIVGKFLCVNDVHSEFIADKVFRTIVKIVREFRVSLCGGKTSKSQANCVSDFDADKTLIQLMPAISSSLREAGVGKLLCKGKAARLMLQILLRKLFDLKIEQLDTLNYVGVCLETAPTSMVFEPESLHLCHGFNIPGKTEVTFHVPTAKENEIRSELLRNSLSLLPTQPTLVTVCRSMRDGYTPWAFFASIEKAVMEALQSVFKDVTEESYHYDENLLGGKKGWPNRD